jgi:hypothetical protein
MIADRLCGANAGGSALGGFYCRWCSKDTRGRFGQVLTKRAESKYCSGGTRDSSVLMA